MCIRDRLDRAYRRNVKEHNEKVEKNCYVLSKITDCIKFCGAFELALQGHREGDDFSNPGIFRVLVDFTGQLDTALREHLHDTTIF